MIKYVEYDSIDEHGRHIIPVNSIYQMNKTASSFSPELMKVILNLQRRPDRYYMVVNALGSYEVWGCNRNGDAFPEVGLTYKSLRTDMGTQNDYGYKTFEYYAKLYRHHVNKDPVKSFGEVIFAHWNPSIHRVELIVAVNKETGADIIEAVENDQPVAVSMGCKVKYDRCSICDNHAKTRKQYCIHLKNHMRQIVTPDLAKRWSIETGKNIIPGMQVFAWNDHPRFFDISRVYIGADRTSFVLGKAASEGPVVASVDIGEVMGVTDNDIDKLAIVGKKGEIDKNVGGEVSQTEVDGRMSKSDPVVAIRKALDEGVEQSIVAEPKLPNGILDAAASSLPLSTIFSTLFGMGIHPKPEEVQRIVLVRIGEKNLADDLEGAHQIFDYDDETAQPLPLDISNNSFSDTLGKVLVPQLEERSCFPAFLEPRIKRIVMIKQAAPYSSTAGNDYWIESGPGTGSFIRQSEISPAMKALGGLAAIYAGLKMKAMGYSPKQLAAIFVNKPWLRSLIGGGVMYKIYSGIDKAHASDPLLRPASEYESVLQDTQFSGHLKQSALKGSGADMLANAIGMGELVGGIALPSSYILKAYNQRSMYKTGKPLFPGAGGSPSEIATKSGLAAGAGTLLTSSTIQRVKKGLSKIR